MIDEALDFVNAVSIVFADDREKYDEFLTILKDARNVTDLRGIIARMEELLKG
ncbi:paired amphipathic helix protein Sin3-like 4-like, partial [Trifolium medium]|nr:paired amphipathic helix protein Sin3-like 4-like [Trifolium medium]